MTVDEKKLAFLGKLTELSYSFKDDDKMMKVITHAIKETIKKLL